MTPVTVRKSKERAICNADSPLLVPRQMPRGIQLLAEEPKEHRDDLVVRADVAQHEFAVRVLNDAGADRPLEGRDGIRGDLECVCVTMRTITM